MDQNQQIPTDRPVLLNLLKKNLCFLRGPLESMTQATVNVSLILLLTLGHDVIAMHSNGREEIAGR